MPLDKQLVPLSLGIGVDTKTDPKQVIATKLTQLQNGIFGEGLALKKRNGYAELGSIGSGNAISSFQDQLVGFDGLNVKSYSANQSQFNSVGKKTAVDISKKVLSHKFGNNGFGDLAYNSGLYGLIYTANNIAVYDSVTGQELFNQVATGTGTNLNSRCQSLGTKLIFVYTTNTQIGYLYVDVSAPTVLSAPVILVSDYGGGAYDCMTIGGNLAFVYTTASNTTKYFYVDTTLTVSTIHASGLHLNSLGIFGDNANNVWVGNTVGTPGGSMSVNYFIIAANFSGMLLTQQNIETISPVLQSNVPNINGCFDGNYGNFYYELSDPSGVYTNNFIKTAQFDVNGNPGNPVSVLIRSSSMYSKPFIYNGIIYMVSSYGNILSSLEPTFFLIDGSGYVSAKFSMGVAAGTENSPLLRDIINLGNGVFTMSYDEIDLIDIAPGNTKYQTGISQMTFTFGSPLMTNKIGENLEVSGGLLTMFDGVNSVEHGFNVYPENVIASGHTTGGLLGTGSYQYVVVYEWTDAQGQLHQSAPSIPVTMVTTTATSSATITVPTLRITDKQNVYIFVYRTIVNGTQFYQITNSPASGTALANNKSVDALTFVDTLADTAILGNNQLYTNGGEFENIEIPSTSIIWTYQNRLLGVYAENNLKIGYSKQVIQGSPVEFNDSFVIDVPENDGGVTAGIQMDDKNIIFKQNSIYYMVGQGPSANGQNNDFTTPVVISTDCGCIDKKSVVIMPRGVMFKSKKGIYLLDRSLAVEYIGSDVEGYNSSNVTSVKMIENVNQIRFTLDSGIALVYDYYYKQWSTFSNINAVDSCIFQGLFTYIMGNGIIPQETLNLFTDMGAFVALSFTTAWFSFTRIQGFQRAYKMLILGQWFSAHTLQFQFAINFDPTIVQTVSVPLLANQVPLQNRIFITNQKEETYQLTVTEQQSAPYGQGLSISALTFEIGGKKGLYKMPSANSYG